MTMIRLGVCALVFMGCGDSDVPSSQLDEDGDGFTAAVDCNDHNSAVFPNNDERCDGVDNNCDGLIDDASSINATLWYMDSDGDGFGDATQTQMACSPEAGWTRDNTDCDDTDATKTPKDLDGDGYSGCEGDCDDTRDNWYPAEHSVETIHTEYDRMDDGVADTSELRSVMRDLDGNIVVETVQFDEENDGSYDSTATYTTDYNDAGQPTFIRRSSDSPGRAFLYEETITYSPKGHETGRIAREDHEGDGRWDYIVDIERTVNVSGQIVRQRIRTDSDGDGVWESTRMEHNQYDDRGNLAWNEQDYDADGSIDYKVGYAYTYNSENALIRKETMTDTDVDGVFDQIDVMEMTWDDAGNLLTQLLLVYYDGSDTPSFRNQTTRTYDESGNPLSIETAADYEADGQTDNMTRLRYTYSPENRVLSFSFEYDYDGNDVIDTAYWIQYEYDDQGELSRVVTTYDHNMDGAFEMKHIQEHSYRWACESS